MPAQTNQRIDGKRLWDTAHELRRNRRHAEGRRPAPRSVRRRQSRPRPLPRRVRGRWASPSASTPSATCSPAAPAATPPACRCCSAATSTASPRGGKFDGALGVLAGLEVMRSLNDLGITTEAPVELVNWTDEEGSRFGHSLAGLRRLGRRFTRRTRSWPERHRRRDGRRRARRHRLSRPGAGAPLPGRRLFRAAYRARPDPGAREQSRSASSPAPRRRSGTTR